MKAYKVWGIYRTEAPIFEVIAVQPQNSVEFPLVGKEFKVDGLPADVGIGIVLPIRSSPLATGLPVHLCTGIPTVAL